MWSCSVACIDSRWLHDIGTVVHVHCIDTVLLKLAQVAWERIGPIDSPRVRRGDLLRSTGASYTR